MRSRLRFWKYPITIVLLISVIAAFALVYVLSDKAAAPDESVGSIDPVVTEALTGPDDAGEPEDAETFEDENGHEADGEPESEPDDDTRGELEDVLYPNPMDAGYITINIDSSEIHRGNLVLVNHEHTFSLSARLDLVNIPEERTVFFRVLGDNYMLSRHVVAHLSEMMEVFIDETGNNTIAVISGFRTYDSQQRILDDYTRRMGRTGALRWVALPGHSEHHTGLAFDFGVYAGGSQSTFTGTGATAWFSRNAHNFGFILRFPENRFDITQTEYEPWHYRFVGLPHSAIIKEKNLVLEEYLEMLRDYTFEEPFEFEHDGILYGIYFTTGNEIRLPLNSEFDISGNNIDGFIITYNKLEYDPSAVTGTFC